MKSGNSQLLPFLCIFDSISQKKGGGGRTKNRISLRMFDKTLLIISTLCVLVSQGSVGCYLSQVTILNRG